MTYIDGFVAAVSNERREEYRAHAARAAEVFKDHGAVRVVETWGNDVPEGQLTSFRMAVKQEETETVVFAWIAWPSKAVRDAAWPKVMEDPRLQPGTEPMPFDGKRMIYGGFEVMLDV